MSQTDWSVVITRSAELDLFAIYDYIAERSRRFCFDLIGKSKRS